MKRIQSTDAVGVAPAASESGTTGYFTNGDPGVPTPATTVTAEWLNRVQEELVEAIEGAGLTLDGNDNTQLLQAIQAIATATFADQSEVDAGTENAKAVAPDTLHGYVRSGTGRQKIGDIVEAWGILNHSSPSPDDTVDFSALVVFDAADYNIQVTRVTRAGGALGVGDVPLVTNVTTTTFDLDYGTSPSDLAAGWVYHWRVIGTGSFA